MPKTHTLTKRSPRARKAATQPGELGAEPEVPEPPAARQTKLGLIMELVSRPDGARVEELMAATGWQAHSVRGALSGGLKKQLKLHVVSEKTEAGRVYRVVSKAES